MPIPIDYQRASVLLSDAFSSAQQDLANNAEPPVDASVAEACQGVIRSATQAYREVLLGCVLAKLLNPAVNVRKPYAGQGDDAFNGRTLDERVVNRFLKHQRIPSSAGSYLSVFRRSVQFVPDTHGGLRDKVAYDALLRVLDYVDAGNLADLMQLLRHLLFQFARLREEATIPLARPGRISLDQFDAVLGELLANPSGGRFPLLLDRSLSDVGRSVCARLAS
jgi:hypothetical protein